MAYARTQQNAYLVNFPKWDEDRIPTEENKSLTILGDFSSVDIELLGNVGNKWFRQSQDNPLTLPLDSSMDDTVLLSLAADLTDTTAGAPIIYAYLNDGSLQGWHAEHNKRYIGIPSPDTSSSALAQPQNAKDTETKDTEMVSDSATPTPAPMAPTFGQSDSLFGQRPNAIEKTAFGQAQDTPAFGQPAFGQASFGQASFGQPNNNSTSPFGSIKPAIGFGAFASAGTGAFGSTSTFNSFGAPTSTGHSFVQGSTSATPSKSTSDVFSQNISPTITQEASMSDSTTDLGGLSLDTTASDSKSVNSMFGSFGAPTISNLTETSLGGLVKPASGFGVFGGFKTSGAFDLNSKPSSTANAFATPTQNPSSGFGQSGFGQSKFGQTGFVPGPAKSTFGQPSFGQPAFGKPSLGETASATTTANPKSGGFGAFASAPTSFTNATTTQQARFEDSKPQASGAFSVATPFGSATTGTSATTFTVPLTSKQPSGFGTQESKPDVTGGFAAFASPSEKPFGSDTVAGGFTPASKGFSAFVSNTPAALTSTPDSKSEPPKIITPVALRTSVFGTPLESTTTPSSVVSKDAATSTTPKETPTRTIALSPPSSPEPKFASVDASPEPKPVVGGAFANIQSTPSSFQPAAGFGAFASTTPKDSPFFKKQEQTTPVTPFTPITAKAPSSIGTTPTFGSTSVLGPSRSAFGSTTPKPVPPAPVKSTTTPSSGGSAFSAFSGSSSPLAVVAGQQKSFSDLLKTGGEESKDPEKLPAPLLPTMGAVPPPSRDKAVTPEDKGKGKFKVVDSASESTGRDESFSNISASSSSSSFVEVEEHDQSSDQDDRSDFLTTDEETEEGGSDEESLPEDDEVKSPTPSPMTVPLPPSRSASATPQPEVKVQVSDLSSPSIQNSSPREEGATSPGTPKEIKETNGLPSAASPLGIGLGRPSTRPVRRSPLANAVVLSQTEVQEEDSTSSSSQRPTTPIPTSVKGPDPTHLSPASGVPSPFADMLPKKAIIPVSSSVFSFGQRPATPPPASSSFGQVPNKSAPILTFSPLVPATTTPSTSQQQDLVGTRPPGAPEPTVSNVFGMASFTLGKTPPPVSAGSPGIHATAFAPSVFSLHPKAAQKTPDHGLFGNLSKQPAAVGSAAESAPAQDTPKRQENEIVEEGMQKECINLVRTVERELEEVRFCRNFPFPHF